MSATKNDIRIYPEPTPNPTTMKLVTSVPVLAKGTMDFPSVEKAAKSPLAKKLFQIPGVRGVFLGSNFVTLTKNEYGAWNDIIDLAIDGLKAHLEAGQSVADTDVEPTVVDDDSLSQKIVQVLDNEIRPAVAMDGGDISFVSCRDGVVTLQMRGACAGCPSSTMTLKMGIERRLREEFPEIQSVVSV